MKRARSEHDEEHVFEDSDKVEPFIWRNEFVDVFAKYMLNCICENYTTWSTTEQKHGDKKGLKKGERALRVLAGIDIPDSVLEPRFVTSDCFLSLTRYKQLKPFATHFRQNVAVFLAKELKEKNIFKFFDFGLYAGDRDGSITLRFQYWIEK